MSTAYTNRHPLALILALLFIVHKGKHTDFEYAVHDVIAKLSDLAGWSDERKADLYAMIVESVTAADTCIVMEGKINTCLWKNEGHYR